MCFFTNPPLKFHPFSHNATEYYIATVRPISFYIRIIYPQFSIKGVSSTSLDVRSTNRIGNCKNCDTTGPRQENPLSEGRAIMKIKSPGITKSASPISKDFPVFHARLFDRLLFIVNKYATKELFIPLERR